MDKKLTAVSWIITNNCNLRCKHCYPGSGAEYKHERVPSADEISRLCESVKTVNPNIVIFSGGEPMLCSQIYTYISEMKRRIQGEVWMCTNGLFIDQTTAKQLAIAGITGVSIGITHPNPEKEDSFRGGNNLQDKIKTAVKAFHDNNIFVTLDMTLTTFNVDYIDDFVELAADMKADVIMFKRFRPVGRGKEHISLKLSPKKNMAALNHIYQLALSNSGLQIKVDDPLYSLLVSSGDYSQYPDYMKYTVSDQNSIVPNRTNKDVSVDAIMDNRYWGCKAGIEWVGIDHEGNVSPCPLLGYAGKIIGNIHNNDLFSIIEQSEDIKKLRLIDKSRCSKAGICGGCRTEAYVATGDMFARDPMCCNDCK